VSKAALNALTRWLAGELRADRTLVNAVCPGWTATDMGEWGWPPGGGGGRQRGVGRAAPRRRPHRGLLLRRPPAPVVVQVHCVEWLVLED